MSGGVIKKSSLKTGYVMHNKCLIFNGPMVKSLANSCDHMARSPIGDLPIGQPPLDSLLATLSIDPRVWNLVPQVTASLADAVTARCGSCAPIAVAALCTLPILLELDSIHEHAALDRPSRTSFVW